MLTQDEREKIQANDGRLVRLDLSERILDTEALQELSWLIQENTQLGHIIWSLQQPQQEQAYIQQNIQPILDRNNESFRVWPSDYEHIIFSSHVYNCSGLNDNVEVIVKDVEGNESKKTTLRLGCGSNF